MAKWECKDVRRIAVPMDDREYQERLAEIGRFIYFELRQLQKKSSVGSNPDRDLLQTNEGGSISEKVKSRRKRTA